MQINRSHFDNLIKDLSWLEKASISTWEYIDVSGIDLLIRHNMRLIIGQTNNEKTAPQLQKSLFALSDRISTEHNFNTSKGRHLAFKVTCLAMGIYPLGPNFEWENFPGDPLEFLFSKILHDKILEIKEPKPIRSFLKKIKRVSKGWKANAEKVEKNWIDQDILALCTYPFKTAKEAIQYVIAKDLLSANFKNFTEITDADLTELIGQCPTLLNLTLEADNIRDFPVEKLTNLQMLVLNHYDLNKGIKLIYSLQSLSQLTTLILLNLQGKGTTIVDALKKLPQLTTLKLNGQIPGNKLANALKHLSKLIVLDLNECGYISGNTLAEMLKSLSNLTHLKLSWEYDLKKNKNLAEALKKHPHLTDLDFPH